MKENKGFTLLELLVVIAIIALLATLAIISMRSAQAEARDSKRRADIATLQSAINIYFDENTVFPRNGCDFDPENGNFVCNQFSAAVFWIPNLEGYMSPPPVDPGKHTAAWMDNYIYLTDVGGSTYTLLFNLEQLSEANQEDLCEIGSLKLTGIDWENPHIWSTRCPD